MNITYEKSNGRFYVVVDRIELRNDREVARVMAMPVSKYRGILLRKFYAHQSQYSKDCYFLFEERAKEVVDWVNSIRLLNTLKI